MVGRGTRRFPGKDYCLILDVVGATSRHDLVTAATLFGVPAAGVINESVVEAVAAMQRAEDERAAQGQLITRTVDLFCARPLHWVPAGAGRFALAIGEGGTLVLDSLPDAGWAVRQLTRDRREVTLQTGLDLGYAQGWAEDHARQLGAVALVDRGASWRGAPVSERQLETGRRCRVPLHPGMTKGEATDLLTAHFARGRRR